jgi:large repetitive protein
VDPGDVLLYTIVISNAGATPATEVFLRDDVPNDTTYVADSLRLNGIPRMPDGGVSPLIEGIRVQSQDNPGEGIVSPGGTAVITFEVRVDDGTAEGTIIRNQGSMTSNELPPDLTDADGLPANGRQPTVIVVGQAQLLSITKEVFVVGGGIAQAGGQLEYVVRVTNNGKLPRPWVLSPTIWAPLAGQVSYVAGSARSTARRPASTTPHRC